MRELEKKEACPRILTQKERDLNVLNRGREVIQQRSPRSVRGNYRVN